MSKIYGVGCHSIATIYDLLLPICQKMQVSLQVIDSKECKISGQILLFPDFELFRGIYLHLQGRRVTPIIFDSPLLLLKIDQLYMLDSQTPPSLSYIFGFQPISQKRLVSLVTKVDHTPPLHCTFKKLQIIPELLGQVKTSGVLEAYNDLMRITKPEQKDSVRFAVLTFLFIDFDLVHFRQTLQKIYSKRYVKNKAIAFYHYFNSEDSQQLRHACQDIANCRAKKKPIIYSKIVKKFAVSQFELRYLVKLWVKLQKT